MENKKIYIIPDVHGRQFWRPVLQHLDENCEIVFLGDYLDPYSHENITPEFALEQFKEIIEIARNNKNVHLLLGNHDLEYMLGRYICYCRCNDYDYYEIKDLFIDNADLFNIAWDTILDNSKKFLFSHAGVHTDWIETNKQNFDGYNIYSARVLNELFHTKKLDLILGDVSRERGGDMFAGSIVWADIREYLSNIYKVSYSAPEHLTQIVGHTMLKEPVQIGNVICLDTKKLFVLDAFGDIYEYGQEKPYNIIKINKA